MPIRGKDNPKPFVKGDPRINRKGRPKKLPDIDVLLAEVLGDEEGDRSGALEIIKKLKKLALSGNIRAAEILLDRAYGKPKQRMEHTGSDGSAIEHNVKGLWFFKPATEILERLKKGDDVSLQPDDQTT